MKKIFIVLTAVVFLLSPVFAQSDEDLFNSSDDELFGGSDDDLFGASDDDLFSDDGIEEFVEVPATTESTKTTDLRKGILYQDGNIKVGGNFTTALDTSTVLYREPTTTEDEDIPEDEKDTFKNRVKDTVLTPTLNSFLFVDARPNQNLRMYTKFGFAYPFEDQLSVYYIENTNFTVVARDNQLLLAAPQDATTKNWFKLQELFTDFSIADTAFFRFGIHTVTWGAGYFFSPVSDMINTSSINPEDVEAQIDGSLNLRTQITFPNTQNCLWFYIIPDTNFVEGTTASSYAIKTALAGKAEFVIGSWELGLGGFYKYQQAPKAMLTATGSIRKLGLFSEFVYSYGGASEWKDDTEWTAKSSIFQFTIGGMYNWKRPSITVAGQYYFDGNDVDKTELIMTRDQSYTDRRTGEEVEVKYYADLRAPSFFQGHNFALLANFGRLFGTTTLNARIFGMVNLGRDAVEFIYDNKDLQEQAQPAVDAISKAFTSAIVSASLSYRPINELILNVGPYITWSDFETKPEVALKLNFTFGGGKF